MIKANYQIVDSTHLDTPAIDVPLAKNAARRDFASFVFAQSSIPRPTMKMEKCNFTRS